MIRHQAGNSKGSYNYNAYTYFNVEWAPHFHSNLELIFAMGGELTLTVNGRKECMGDGDVALILPNQIHSISGTPPFSMWIAVFSEQFVPHFVSRHRDVAGTRSVFTLSRETDAFVRASLMRAESSTTMKKACFYAVCDEFARSVPTEPRKGGDPLICHALSYVEEHYMEELTLSDIAKVLGYEYHYLSRLLNQGYHINFSELVNQYRVDNAIRLLSSTDMSIADIAMASGFSSIRNFNHSFRSITGMAPRDMRSGKRDI